MNSRVGHTALIIVGAVALLVGAVWVGQGMNLIPGSFMTGDRTWLVIGLIVGVVGVILLVIGIRGAKRPR